MSKPNAGETMLGLLCSTLTSPSPTVFISWICCFPKKEKVDPKPTPFQGEKWVSAGTPDLQHTNVNTALQLCWVTQGASRAPEILHWEQIITVGPFHLHYPEQTQTWLSAPGRLCLSRFYLTANYTVFHLPLEKSKDFSLCKYPLPQTHSEHIAGTRPHLFVFRQHTQSNNN